MSLIDQIEKQIPEGVLYNREGTPPGTSICIIYFLKFGISAEVFYSNRPQWDIVLWVRIPPGNSNRLIAYRAIPVESFFPETISAGIELMDNLNLEA